MATRTLAAADGAGLPRLSRSLLLPGALPPHSHFGVTLLRHVVVTGLRSALHRLGLPLVPAAPVRIVELRLYLDRDALVRELGGHPGGGEAVAALVDPGGSAAASAGAARLTGAGLLHRPRLLRSGRLPKLDGDEPDPLTAFRTALSALLPALSDALLAELLAALARRRGRAEGRSLPPCLGREAWRFCAGRPARLDRLGPPDPLLPSWATAGPPGGPAPGPPPRHRHRGGFRELYRAALDRLGPLYRRLAAAAVDRGLLDHPDDALFLPLDLADDLAGERRPAWLAPAVAANRREYLGSRARPSPPDEIDPDGAAAAPPEAWPRCPLNPLP